MPLSPSKLAQLEAKAREVRRGAVTMTNRAQTGPLLPPAEREAG